MSEVLNWVPAGVVAAISVTHFVWVRVRNGKDQAKLAGKFEGIVQTQLEGLKIGLGGVQTTLADNMAGNCPVAKKVDAVEDRLDKHIDI